MDLIKDETDVGQVVKVTSDEDGVEFLNFNDVGRRVDESDHVENDLRFGLLFKISIELKISCDSGISLVLCNRNFFASLHSLTLPR